MSSHSTSNSDQTNDSSNAEDKSTKRAAEDLIKKYFQQLTTGCGNDQCDNIHCASSRNAQLVNKDEAAGLALRLMFKKAKLCDIQDSIVIEPRPSRHHILTKETVKSLIESGKSNGHYNELVHSIGRVFSSSELLNASFTNNTDDVSISSKIDVCVNDIEEVYELICDLDDEAVENAMIMAISNLGSFLEIDLKMSTMARPERFLNQFIIVLLHPGLQSPAYLDTALPNVLRAMACLDISLQATLVTFWSTFTALRLKQMLSNLLQLITYQLLVGPHETEGKAVNDDVCITSAIKCMKSIYFASLLGGIVLRDPGIQQLSSPVDEEDNTAESEPIKDALMDKLKLKCTEYRQPLLAYEDFYNDLLFDKIEMDRDYTNYKLGEPRFSFLHYPFSLDTATKSLALFYDNRIRMYSERRMTLLVSLMGGQVPSPYLRLRVRRDHLIQDALIRLEMITQDNPNDLKKQLFVEFEGEQGIDEGGVSKEFFQLVIEELFNPDYGMFVYNEDTRLFWLNPLSFEIDAHYTLIGLVFGLAIYNSIILDVRFPAVLYRKLFGIPGTHSDLISSHPVIYHSLKELLAYEGDCSEEIMQTFQVAYHDVFGTKLTHELKENGCNIPVTNDNRQEFVDLYADFLLNKSVHKQFQAFKRGYDMVTGDSIIKTLFRSDELELLICGSKVFDFDNLEKTTEYDGGYTSDSDVIKYFWDVVRSLGLEEKRKLLMFTTGSDRVPVGGLAKLKLIIAKNGPDSDRLPTAHTCFNVLLLPEYATKEKLENRLLKAITHAKGFGLM